ncbi:MAG: outer membrane lipoprotein LolB [Chromatiales bacterium]|jgi:outer membrane lipoprotein LolB|nr:outer membrane lipoprotein LolB [Chromatiales bacterium]
MTNSLITVRRDGCCLRTRAARAWMGFVVALLLSGCETVPDAVDGPAVADPKAAFEVRQKQLAEITDWHATGKLGLKTADDSWSVTVRWKQMGDRFAIRLSGPLGQGTVELKGEPGQVTLQTSEPRIYTAQDAEQLIEQVMGWRLPVTGLRHWLMGNVAPDATPDGLVLDPSGRPISIKQAGWTVTYLSYAAHGEAIKIDLPLKITLVNEKLNARAVIRLWEF